MSIHRFGDQGHEREGRADSAQVRLPGAGHCKAFAAQARADGTGQDPWRVSNGIRGARKHLRYQLWLAGADIADGELVQSVLAGLPAGFAVVVTELMQRKELVLHDVLTSLLTLEMRLTCVREGRRHGDKMSAHSDLGAHRPRVGEEPTGPAGAVGNPGTSKCGRVRLAVRVMRRSATAVVFAGVTAAGGLTHAFALGTSDPAMSEMHLLDGHVRGSSLTPEAG